jgi:hypothetical protein
MYSRTLAPLRTLSRTSLRTTPSPALALAARPTAPLALPRATAVFASRPYSARPSEETDGKSEVKTDANGNGNGNGEKGEPDKLIDSLEKMVKELEVGWGGLIGSGLATRPIFHPIVLPTSLILGRGLGLLRGSVLRAPQPCLRPGDSPFRFLVDGVGSVGARLGTGASPSSGRNQSGILPPPPDSNLFVSPSATCDAPLPLEWAPRHPRTCSCCCACACACACVCARALALLLLLHLPSFSSVPFLPSSSLDIFHRSIPIPIPIPRFPGTPLTLAERHTVPPRRAPNSQPPRNRRTHQSLRIRHHLLRALPPLHRRRPPHRAFSRPQTGRSVQQGFGGPRAGRGTHA